MPAIGPVVVEFRCTRDWISQTSTCHVDYRSAAGAIVASEEYSVALVTRNELLTAYVAAGLDVISEFGSLQFQPIDEASNVLVHVLGRVR